MGFLLFFISFLVVISIVSALIKSETKRIALSCFGTVAASILGILVLFLPQINFQEIIIQTNIPMISFSFGADNLSKFFLVVIFLASIAASFYGFGYLKGNHKLATTVSLFPLLVATMAGVIISRDALSFLIFWELMSLASFFLVTTEHENKDVQNAGWIYLIATHLATAFLMAFFVILARENGSLLFSYFGNSSLEPSLAGLLFVFAFIGFGTKAGVFPLHVWLPHAHPAAPSYISAIMSGVMIKTGIYGIIRAVTFLGVPSVWWGGLLIIVGVLSVLVGILYALMQKDLKRLLAYSSVENIGIIVVGIGIGILGMAKGNVLVASLGFGGAIFHVLNHSIFKSALFMCSGNLLHQFHHLSIDKFGGLLKKIPITGTAFFVAAIAISGLPPFNGFISEWLIYIGLYNGADSFTGYSIFLSVAGLLSVAFAGGLAIACFARAFGVIFLGEPRSEIPTDLKESLSFLTLPIIFLVFLSLLIGLFPQFLWPIISRPLADIMPGFANAAVITTRLSLNWISWLFFGLILFSGLLLIVRKLVYSRKEKDQSVTWDCGYRSPTPRMQYSASSFAEPVVFFFKSILKPSVKNFEISGFFPKQARFEQGFEDSAEVSFFQPVFEKIGSLLLFIRSRKKSTVQHYLLLIFITLIVLFVLEVWIGI